MGHRSQTPCFHPVRGVHDADITDEKVLPGGERFVKRRGSGLPVPISTQPMARILVTEEIAEGGLDRLRADGHEVDVQLGLSSDELLSAIPGATVVAAHAELVPGDEALWGPDFSNDYFNGNIVVGAEIGDGAGRVYTDFKIHDDGYSRFVVLDQGLTPRQAGRTLQRLFEIEAYRIMALLALPIARRQSPRIVAIEKSLASLTDAIAQEGGDDEALLHELTRLAAEVERALAASQFRFGACRAYFELVVTRIGELRETRLPGVQTIQEFMARRFTPAVATCSTTSQRLHDLSERVAQASALLSTRVSIARERQNQSVLTSMDRRAKQQLRLQQTVEGLSLAAIVYYLAGLAFYVAKGLKAGGLHFEPDLAVGVAIPLIAVAVFMGLRRVRRKLGRD